VGTKAEIQKLVLSLANEGKGCIFISSELDEVLRTSHRVMVMRDRSMVAELTGEEMNEQRIMETIAGTGTLAQPAAVVPQAVEMESAR
jgi:simple sugar transport system ATP-binding protein